MNYEILLSKLLRLPLKKCARIYDKFIKEDNHTFAQSIQAMEAFETKARYLKMIDEDATFELMLALSMMSMNKNKVVDELFEQLKGYPMVAWMEVIGEFDAQKINGILKNYGTELTSPIVETLIINLPRFQQAYTIEKYQSSLDPTNELFQSFYYCLVDAGKAKVEQIFPNSIKINPLLELEDIEDGLIAKNMIAQKEKLQEVPMDSIIEFLLLKEKNIENALDILQNYSDRLHEISDMRFKLLFGRLKQLGKDQSRKPSETFEFNKKIFELFKPKFKNLGLIETLDIMDAEVSAYYDNKIGNDIVYEFLDVAYKDDELIKYVNEKSIINLIERFENDCSKKEYSFEDFEQLVEKTITTEPQKLIHDDYIEAMIACRKLMKNHEINNQNPYYIELKEKFKKMINAEIQKDGTTEEPINTDALFYRLIKGTVDFSKVFNIKTYKGLAYLTKAAQVYEDPDNITKYLTDEQVSKLNISPLIQWQKIKIREAQKKQAAKEAEKEKESWFEDEENDNNKNHNLAAVFKNHHLENAFNERLALQLLCYFSEQKARHIINSNMKTNRMEHIFDNIDYYKIEIDENGSPIVNQEVIDFFFGKGSVKEKNSIMNKIIREELPEFDRIVPEFCNNYEEIKEACNGIITVKRIISYYQNKKLPDLKPHEYNYRKALMEINYTNIDKLAQAIELCDDAAKRKVSTIPKQKGQLGNLSYEILDLKDSMHIASGYLSHCCFVINGYSDSSLRHSMQSKNGRIMFVYHNGKFLGQSWIWRNGDVVCFDSVEAGSFSHGAYKDILKVVDVYKQVAKEILEESKYNESEEERVKIVTIGKSDFRFEGLDKLEVEEVPRPLERDCYISDSKEQFILAGEMPENPRYDEVSVKYRDPRKRVYQILDTKDANIDYLDEALLKMAAIKYEATGEEPQDDLDNLNQLFVGDDWYIKTTTDGEIEVEITDDYEETIKECRDYAEVLGVNFERNYDRNEKEILPTKDEVVKKLKLAKVESRRG